GAILGAGLAAAALLAWEWLRLGMPPPACPFHALTGLPCPTCGTTRLVRALLQGDVAGAFAHNPFVFACGAALSAWAVASVACVVTRRPVVIRLDRRETLALRVTVVVASLASWAWLLARRE